MSVDRVLRVGLMSLVLVSSVASAQTPGHAQPETAPQPRSPQGQAEQAPAEASEVNPLATRPQIAAALRFLQAQGVKLTTLGTEGGLAGYLGESPNSRMQVFYVTPDGGHVIAGLMFDAQGANVTGVQLGEMQRRFESAQKQLSSTTGPVQSDAVQPDQNAGASKVPPQAVQTPSAQEAPPKPAPSPAAEKTTAQKTSSAAPELPDPLPQKTAAAPAPTAMTSPSTAAEKYVSGFDRGAVERALREVPWFQVGVKEAPALYMVVDPQCPFCHAAWQRLQPYVYGKKLQLRIIMIAGLKGSMPQALSILSRQNPGEAWLTGEGSVDNFTVAPPPQPDSQEYQIAQKYLDMNAGFVRTFGITSTPTLMYLGKDERLYSSIGLPEDADVFMSAMH